MKNENILLVDDEKVIYENFSVLLEHEPYNILYADTLSKAVNILRNNLIKTVLCDINLPDNSGYELLNIVKDEFNNSIPIIIITAYSSWQTARQAFNSGAFDYLAKPINIDELKIIINKSITHFNLQQENNFLKYNKENSIDFIGESDEIKEILKLIKKVSLSQTTILITGESGTGKEVIAKLIHKNSLRKNKMFFTVNCGAIPENLLESELFGYVKGAFTGANKSKPGYFELANNGTLFLDEIGELPLNLQVKLLRVVEGNSFLRVGGTEEIKTDVRILAATNKNLLNMIKENKFRKDLYYRLAVININIPPLRKRKKDIIFLSRFFLNKFNKQLNKNIKNFDPKAIEFLKKHSWPGNVRELQNIIEHAFILEESDTITYNSLPIIKQETELPDLDLSDNDYETLLNNFEKKIISSAINKFHGNKNKAASFLNISRQNLQYKYKKLFDNNE